MVARTITNKASREKQESKRKDFQSNTYLIFLCLKNEGWDPVEKVASDPLVLDWEISIMDLIAQTQSFVLLILIADEHIASY